MKHFASLLALALALSLVACERTTEGAAQDIADTTEAALTPRIKAALIANPILNDPANEINVETDAATVYLRGHVSTPEAKDEATQIAQRVIDESGSSFILVNELEIAQSPAVEDPAIPPVPGP
jgi:hypothetical protein